MPEPVAQFPDFYYPPTAHTLPFALTIGGPGQSRFAFLFDEAPTHPVHGAGFYAYPMGERGYGVDARLVIIRKREIVALYPTGTQVRAAARDLAAGLPCTTDGVTPRLTTDGGQAPPMRPDPAAIAADPPPFQFLPPSDGHYWLLKTPADGPVVKRGYPAERMQSESFLQTQFIRNLAWIGRHFAVRRMMTWPDGLTEPATSRIDWKGFGLWVRNMCRAVPAGNGPATAEAILAASASSPGIAPEGGRNAPSYPSDHQDVRRDFPPHSGSDQPATCHGQSGTTSPQASPLTGSMPPSPNRVVPGRPLPSAAPHTRPDTGSAPGSSCSGLEPCSSPSVVRTNDGEAASPSAQADGGADAEQPFLLRWSTASERTVNQYHFIGPFPTLHAARDWAMDPVNNPEDSPCWQVLSLRPALLRRSPPVFHPGVPDRPSPGDFA